MAEASIALHYDQNVIINVTCEAVRTLDAVMYLVSPSLFYSSDSCVYLWIMLF